jgi:hypothetical protein
VYYVKKVHQQSEDIEAGEVESTLVLIVHCIHKPKYIMRALCRVILTQTVERQGSLVFCMSKSSAAERE